MPTVFRPLFTKINNDVYITGFREAPTVASLQTVPRPILDLTSFASNNLPSIVEDDLIFGVPLVIGARKGCRTSTSSPPRAPSRSRASWSCARAARRADRISDQPVLCALADHALGGGVLEFLRFNYSRPVFIYVTNRTTMTLTMTRRRQLLIRKPS